VSVAEYRRLVGALAAAASRRDAELAAAERSYQDGAAVAAADVARADTDAREADRRTGAAATAVVEVDREAARLWDELRRVGGWRTRTRRLGELPAPATPASHVATPASGPAASGAAASGPAPSGAAASGAAASGAAASGAAASGAAASGAAGAAVELLDAAAQRIDQARRGAPRPPLPRWLLPLLPPLGGACAIMAGLVAGGLITVAQLDTDLRWPLRLLGWLAFLLAPFTGVPPAALWVDRQFGSRLDTGATALIVLGGLTAGCALSLLFAR
jgi:hypothetical protein